MRLLRTTPTTCNCGSRCCCRMFCDLVVKHYRENRNVNFYAKLMNYDASYLTQVFCQYTNGISPLKWIQQYVVTQSKELMVAHPEMSIAKISRQLGFSTPGNFCRYFKQVTGVYPGAYRSSK